MNRETRKQAERKRLAALPDAPFDQSLPPGVLLSDKIKEYAHNYRMIWPFCDENLKPAGYEVTVGDTYSIGGETRTLTDQPGQNQIHIQPFEVVVIQTRETLNIPKFLIARWNIRVRWAYRGLLWVGGPQVDPGYKGYLVCPLYNLSDQSVTLKYGDQIALVDFVTTTPYVHGLSKLYNALDRSRVLFEEYEPDRLRSALATEAKARIEDLSRKLHIYGTAAITLLGILVAALAVIAAESSPERTSAGQWPAFILGTMALLASIIALVQTASSRLPRGWRRVIWWVALTILVVFLAFMGYQVWNLGNVIRQELGTEPVSKREQVDVGLRLERLERAIEKMKSGLRASVSE